MSTLNVAAVLDIRKTYRPGLSSMLAKKYGVTDKAIRLVARRETWKDIDGKGKINKSKLPRTCYSYLDPELPCICERRFWTNVKFSNGCWVWKAGKNTYGYGLLRLHRKYITAHRVAWIFLNGKIPKAKGILHHCDNPPCVNPKHLYPGTPADNARDKVLRGRCNTRRRIKEALRSVRGDEGK